MTNTETRNILVGLASLAGFILLFGLSYGLGGMRAKAEVGFYPVQATFNRIDGLAPGDSVRMGGIEVGTVGIPSLDENFRAALTLKIRSDVRIPRDTSAAIHTDGLFGSKFVVLEPGGDETYLDAGDRIDFTQDSMIVGELLDLIIAQGRKRLGLDDDNKTDQTN